MSNRPAAITILMATMGFMATANAALVNNNYYAVAIGSTTIYDPYTPAQYYDQEQASAAGSLGVGSTTYSIASATIGAVGVAVSASVANDAGAAANAQAFIQDLLTFHVAGGGSANVVARISGSWSATGQPVGQTALVTYALSLDGPIFSGSTDALFAPFGIFTGGSIAGGFAGTYTDGGLWTVLDGHSYNIRAGVTASSQGNSGGTAFIDDPVTFQLPAGVTFTSASGSDYTATAVPAPASVWLLGSALLGVAKVARRRASSFRV